MKAGTAAQREKAANHQAAHGIGTMPNFSSAVSAQRFEAKNSLDDFPTPPWGARAWAEIVVGTEALADKSCWEPAANRGFLVRGLKDYFATMICSDIHDYGAGYPVFDFLSMRGTNLLSVKPPIDSAPDWVVTNPPFNRLLDFTLLGLGVARVGVAIFCRTQCLEGIGRFKNLFQPHANRYCFSQFAERISLVRGCVDPKAGRPAAYGWLTVWKEPRAPEFLLARRHLPPCRARFERDGDYVLPETINAVAALEG